MTGKEFAIECRRRAQVAKDMGSRIWERGGDHHNITDLSGQATAWEEAAKLAEENLS